MKEKMMHITDEQMQLYVQNKLPLYNREQVELELELCEECLDKFMQYSRELTIPALIEIEEQKDLIHHAINMKRYERKVRWIERPWAQCVVAASITAIIVSTGILTGMSSKIANFDEQIIKERPQLTDELTTEQLHLLRNSDANAWLDKTSDVLDKVKQYRFEK